MFLLIESELESEVGLAAVRTENESESLLAWRHLAHGRLADNVEIVIVAHENKSESLHEVI